jgi:DNA protecting protein DprA
MTAEDELHPPRLAATLLGLREARRVIAGGSDAMAAHWAALQPGERDEIGVLAEKLIERDFGLLLEGDDGYPSRLRDLKSPPPFLFYWGNRRLLDQPGVGMCGSRDVSDRGLDAARACGEEVARRNWHVISGYAKGVDTETHLAALRAGAGTVVVLAEGILSFRRKKVFADVPFCADTVLALSQFPPQQRWSAGAAMTRNGVIAALGRALLVIEAGEKGGTLNAGRQGLALGRPVFALDFSDATPAGNRELFAEGAIALRTHAELSGALEKLGAATVTAPRPQAVPVPVPVPADDARSAAGAFWTNRSVIALAGDADPITVITERARTVVLRAMEEGWSGPPFDPFVLADQLDIPVVPRQELSDARTVPVDESRVRIEFNPSRPRGRLRFSIAHELAHTFFPDVAQALRYRSPERARGDDTWQLELLCNIAAAELLMPVGTFTSLAEEPLEINHLMRLRKDYDVSTEALLRRVVRLTDEPTTFFAAARVDGQQVDGPFRIDYTEPSQHWDAGLRRGTVLAPDTILRHCTAVGFTDSGTETWPTRTGKVAVDCVGVAPYPGERFPRVVGFLRPTNGNGETRRTIHYVDGDATAPRGGGRRIIVHVVNDRTANWGGQFARALRDRYPVVQDSFRDWASAAGHLSLGHVHILDVSDELAVATIVAQRGYGESSRPRISYVSLQQGLEQVAIEASRRSASLHMPRLGAGQAGGNWEVIRELIDGAFVSRGLPVTVYTVPGAQFAEPAQGSLPLGV